MVMSDVQYSQLLDRVDKLAMLYLEKSCDISSMTVEEYIKKLKVANKKKIRKKQFDITIQREAASAAEEETLPEEKNIVVEETTTEEDGMTTI